MLRRSVLILAFVITLPMLWAALVTGSASLESVGIRFLIAIPVAAILLAIVRWATRSPKPPADEAKTDHSAA